MPHMPPPCSAPPPQAEDPIYALENNLPIDVQHYLEHHLSQPLLRIFEPVMKNPKDLLSGGWQLGLLVQRTCAARPVSCLTDALMSRQMH
jgi:hypothetical protein